MTVQDVLRALSDYVPLFQTLVWASLIFLIVVLLKKQLRAFLGAVEGRIREGSPIKVGGVELGQQQLVTKTADLGDKVEVFGNPDRFKLLFKAKGSTWSKSTKAMEVPEGCIVQVTTERMNPDGSWANAEALTFVPGVIVIDDSQGSGHHLGALSRSSETEMS